MALSHANPLTFINYQYLLHNIFYIVLFTKPQTLAFVACRSSQ
ncbi:hypothetical protein VHARVF571_310134 [Vibrio harveyi]|nr:hypothetical protein VHARVF571_310134 [Vibrio harveyi]